MLTVFWLSVALFTVYCFLNLPDHDLDDLIISFLVSIIACGFVVVLAKAVCDVLWGSYV